MLGVAAVARCRNLDDRSARILGDDATVTLRSLIAVLIVVAIGGVLVLNRLGAAELCGFNEAVEARVMQDMLERGNLLFPRVSDGEPSYKPPFLHWVATGLAKGLGVREVSAFTARLPSALFALAGLVMTMAFAHRRLGAHAAVLAGLMLLGTWPYVRQARFGRVDMPLAFLETATLLAFLTWASRVGRRSPNARTEPWLWLAALAAACGVLTKGPVGAVLPLTAIAITVSIAQRWDLVRQGFRWGPALALVLVSGSWYALCAIAAKGDFLNLHLGTENLGRFTGALGSMPPWYYLEPLLLGALPLSLLTPVAVAVTLWRFILSRRRTRDDRDLAMRLLAVFWIVTVAFFSVAAYKRRAYLLPIVPAGALLLSGWLSTLAATPNGKALRGAITASCGVLILINLVAVPWQEQRRCPPGRFKAAAEAVRALVPTKAILVSQGGAGGGDLTAMRFYLRHSLPSRDATRDVRGSYILAFSALGDEAQNATRLPDHAPLLTIRPGRRTLTLHHVSREEPRE